MNISIIIFVIFTLLLNYTKGTEKCRQECHRGVLSKTKCIREGRICRKILECSLKEENCERRSKGLLAITALNNSLCRNIKTTLGSGACASCGIRRNCSNIHCTIPTDKPKCYRSKQNNCRLLTSCQLARLNCERCGDNRLQPTNHRACAGLQAGGRKQKCHPIPKLG